MSTSLQNILAEMKTAATTAGFTSVSEVAFNIKSVADTQLPKMFLKLAGISYDKLLIDSALETYSLEIIMITQSSDLTPVSTLKTLCDNFLKEWLSSRIAKMLSANSKIVIKKSSLSNDQALYTELGGESMALDVEISNINNFGGVVSW